MKTLLYPTLSTALLLGVPAAFAEPGGAAETPGFDRPGLLFATDTTPQGHFIFEQGLPDAVLDDSKHVEIMLLQFNSQLRYGLTPDWEVQVGMAPLAYLRVETPAGDDSETGYGDLRVGVKHVLPAVVGEGLGGADVAVQGGLSLPTGDEPFTADDAILDLGITSLWDVGAGRSAGGLVQLTSGDGATDLLLAAAYNVPLSHTAGFYLEAGIEAGDADGTVIGGGIAWMQRWNVQLDAYLLAGVDDDAPDLQTGFGVSIYFL